MFRIREFCPEDIPEVAALWMKVFRASTEPTPTSLLEYFREVFFSNPVRDAGLPSFVGEADNGRIIGFQGVIPRRMVFRGQTIRVAVGTQIGVDPAWRGIGAGIHLMRRLITGPQDLALTDGATDPARLVWTRCGGEVAMLYCLNWTRVLRPVSFAADRLKGRPKLRLLGAAGLPLCHAIDASLARAPRSPYRPVAPQGTASDADDATLIRYMARPAGGPSLRPQVDPETMSWVLRLAAAKKVHGDLRKRIVRNPAGEVIGWYLYFSKPGGTSRVVQLGAVDRANPLVLEHLFHDAARDGSAAISGQAHPQFMQDLSDRRCWFTADLGVLVHSKNREILAAIHQGDSFISRLDGEWFLRFGNDKFS